MKHLTGELHARGAQWVVFRERERGREDPTFERGLFGALDHGLPFEDVVFIDGTCGYAFGGVDGEGAVFVHQPSGGCCGGHGFSARGAGGGRMLVDDMRQRDVPPTAVLAFCGFQI
jgi:hypothetical protein